MESANKTRELVKHEPISLQRLAKLLDEMADYHKQEVSETTARIWYEDLKSYSELAIRQAWVEHRNETSFFPFVSDLKKRMAVVDDTPKSAYQGYRGFTEEEKRAAEEAKDSPEAKEFQETLKRIVEGTNFPKKPEAERRAELKAQAESVK